MQAYCSTHNCITSAQKGESCAEGEPFRLPYCHVTKNKHQNTPLAFRGFGLTPRRNTSEIPWRATTEIRQSVRKCTFDLPWSGLGATEVVAMNGEEVGGESEFTCLHCCADCEGNVMLLEPINSSGHLVRVSIVLGVVLYFRLFL